MLSAEHLPEDSEKQKKRKKALLFFIANVKDLQSEIKRIDAEFSQTSGVSESVWWHAGRIIKFAKGPFGLVTMLAVVIVGVFLFMQKSSIGKPVAVKQNLSAKQVQIITYQGKQIPLSQLFIGHGPDCDSPHYHAIGEATVTSLDGSTLQDPGGCGFGRVKDVQVITVSE